MRCGVVRWTPPIQLTDHTKQGDTKQVKEKKGGREVERKNPISSLQQHQPTRSCHDTFLSLDREASTPAAEVVVLHPLSQFFLSFKRGIWRSLLTTNTRAAGTPSVLSSRMPPLFSVSGERTVKLHHFDFFFFFSFGCLKLSYFFPPLPL